MMFETPTASMTFFLNEVLSLNAQESVGTIEDDTRTIPQ